MKNWKAVWGNLLVKPDALEETDPYYKAAKAAGLELPETNEIKRERQGQTEGIIVSLGGNCFEDWEEPKPKEGDKVVYDKFAGCSKKVDDVEYRIIKDTDIFLVRGES